jgi:DNA-binding NarL/FixJ family response regulator
MSQSIRALLLDDDALYAAGFRRRFRAAFPDVALETRTEPRVEGNFDLYFLDNQFEGEELAERLLNEVRVVNPDALVIAISATLDADILKSLLNLGCNGACDKSKLSDLDEMFRLVRRFINHRKTEPPRSRRGGLVLAIRSITELLREWNARLDSKERELV